MFEIRQKPFGDFTLFELTNSQRGDLLSLIPGYGATVFELLLHDGRELKSILIGYPNPAEMTANRGFKGSKLFPFPNRIDHGTFTWQGETFQIPRNLSPGPHAIHGLVYDKPFLVSKLQAEENYASITTSLNYNGTLYCFPFSFLLEMEFRLEDSGLACFTLVKNTGNKPLPFGDGWHPYFKVPKGRTVNDLHLKIPPVREMKVNDSMIPTGKESDFKQFQISVLIGDTQLDHGFRILKGNERAETILSDPVGKTKTIIWQENYPFLQIYTPSDRQSIAIEPMTCPADALNNLIGLKILQPGEEFKASYGISLQRL